MEKITKSARAIVALAFPPKEGKTMYKVIEGNNLLLLSKDIYESCKKGEFEEVEFTPNGKLTTADGSEINSYRATGFAESELKKLQKATELEVARVDSTWKVKNLDFRYQVEHKNLSKELGL
jgi:hypothetical protein